MEKLNVAVIGVGNMGRHHARAYSEMPQTNLAAVCDANESVGIGVAKKYSCSFYKSYAEMLSAEKIDAVSIAVPTSFHAKVACDILEKGVHVLLEKPLAMNLEEAKAILDKAREKKLRLMVGHIEKFNPAVARLKGLVRTGRLGEIVSLNIQRIGGLPRNTDAGVILDLATHDISISNYLLDSFPKEVYGSKTSSLGKGKEDSASIFLKYEKASSFIEANWITPVKVRQMNVVGTKAFAKVDYVNQTLTAYENTFLSGMKSFDNFDEYLAAATFVDEIKFGVVKKEPLICELEEFVNSIRENREPLASGEDGYKTLEIALKV